MDHSIVAITGLAGHAFGSWKDRISNKMWLHDFLPGHLDCPVRILTYGYNTTLAEHTSRIDGMADLVEGFLRQLESSRAKVQRPGIVFYLVSRFS